MVVLVMLYRKTHPHRPVDNFPRLPHLRVSCVLPHQSIEWFGTYMRCACDILLRMAKMIQIRNVPDELHRTLKVRAAQAGMTLSDYLLSEIEQIAEKPTLSEMMKRLASDEPVELDEPPDVTIRRMRDADDPRDLG